MDLIFNYWYLCMIDESKNIQADLSSLIPPEDLEFDEFDDALANDPEMLRPLIEEEEEIIQLLQYPVCKHLPCSASYFCRQLSMFFNFIVLVFLSLSLSLNRNRQSEC